MARNLGHLSSAPFVYTLNRWFAFRGALQNLVGGYHVNNYFFVMLMFIFPILQLENIGEFLCIIVFEILLSVVVFAF